MDKTPKIIWFISIVVLCALGVFFYNTTSKKPEKQNINTPTVFNDQFVQNNQGFSDGLHNPNTKTTYPLKGEDTGITEKNVYYVNINNDNKMDRITKSFFENGNAHSYYEYKIELNKNDKYVDITPNNLRTINGADCDLQQIQFRFQPYFQIIMIYREMADTWDEPSVATKRVFGLSDNNIKMLKETQLKSICDVKELF